MCKPTPTAAIATIALAFSMAGTGLAASRYLITSKSQIAPNVLKALHGKRGTPGEPGTTGATGSTGATGAAGSFNASNLTVVNGPAVFAAPGIAVTSTAPCPAGQVAVSGGWAGPLVQTDIGFNYPIANDTAWSVTISNNSSIAETVQAVAVCAS